LLYVSFKKRTIFVSARERNKTLTHPLKNPISKPSSLQVGKNQNPNPNVE
jgi:hypothetical protein